MNLCSFVNNYGEIINLVRLLKEITAFNLIRVLLNALFIPHHKDIYKYFSLFALINLRFCLYYLVKIVLTETTLSCRFII